MHTRCGIVIARFAGMFTLGNAFEIVTTLQYFDILYCSARFWSDRETVIIVSVLGARYRLIASPA